MKGLACASCTDLRALPQEDLIPVSCRCGNVTAWWIDGRRGVARFHARDRQHAFGLGLCNTYLLGALSQPMEGQPNEEWRQLHADATDAPGYLFDQSNRGCWALLFRPGQSSDTAWATPQEWGAAHPSDTSVNPDHSGRNEPE